MPSTCTDRLVGTGLVDRWAGNGAPSRPLPCVHNSLPRKKDDQQSCDPHDRPILQRARSLGQDLPRRAQPFLPFAALVPVVVAVHMACAEGQERLGARRGDGKLLWPSLWGPEMLSVSNIRGKIAISALVGGSAAVVGGRGGAPSGDGPGPPWHALACPGLTVGTA